VLIPQKLIEETEPRTGAPAPAAESQPVRYHVAPTRVEAVAAGPDGRSREGAAGLRVRVRQASVAATRREQPTPCHSAVGDRRPGPPVRTRTLMLSYQDGTRRGRAEAATAPGEDR
jgi:hypothetical protein